MSVYFKELLWQYNFSLVVDTVVELSQAQIHHGNHASIYCKIPVDKLIAYHPFSKIQAAAMQHGFSIINAIYRKQFGQDKQFGIIHTDCYKLSSVDEPVTVPFSLNIPLKDTDSATTRWYDFSNNPALKNEETRFPLLDHKKFSAQPPNSINDFLKYCVAAYTMTGPVIINTAIPHNVDALALSTSREILSLWFIDTTTNTMATWEQSKFLETITVD